MKALPFLKIFAVSVFLIALFSAFIAPRSGAPIDSKIRGVNLEGHPKSHTASVFDPIVKTNAEWVSFIPFAYGSDQDEKLSWQGNTWQWWGESKKGVQEGIQQAQSKGFKTMVKPQIWFRGGAYTGHFGLNSTSDWENFEKDYRGYIMQYASVCAAQNVDMFCIGTELENFVEQRTDFWRALIHDIRSVYKGKLTYAANWDAYKRFPLWEELDYIGVDAYFPLSDAKTPKVEQLLRAWGPYRHELKQVSDKNKRPIIFTEYGYRSIDFPAKAPWESYTKVPTNQDAQANCYEALYQKFWSEDWFAGGFFWKWHMVNEKAGGEECKKFTPQNKTALSVIAKWYGA